MSEYGYYDPNEVDESQYSSFEEQQKYSRTEIRVQTLDHRVVKAIEKRIDSDEALITGTKQTFSATDNISEVCMGLSYPGAKAFLDKLDGYVEEKPAAERKAPGTYEKSDLAKSGSTVQTPAMKQQNGYHRAAPPAKSPAPPDSEGWTSKSRTPFFPATEPANPYRSPFHIKPAGGKQQSVIEPQPVITLKAAGSRSSDPRPPVVRTKEDRIEKISEGCDFVVPSDKDKDAGKRKGMFETSYQTPQMMDECEEIIEHQKKDAETHKREKIREEEEDEEEEKEEEEREKEEEREEEDEKENDSADKSETDAQNDEDEIVECKTVPEVRFQKISNSAEWIAKWWADLRAESDYDPSLESYYEELFWQAYNNTVGATRSFGTPIERNQWSEDWNVFLKQALHFKSIPKERIKEMHAKAYTERYGDTPFQRKDVDKTPEKSKQAKKTSNSRKGVKKPQEPSDSEEAAEKEDFEEEWNQEHESDYDQNDEESRSAMEIDREEAYREYQKDKKRKSKKDARKSAAPAAPKKVRNSFIDDQAEASDGDMKSDEEEEDSDLDGFIVPHGHLSDGEGESESEEEERKRHTKKKRSEEKRYRESPDTETKKRLMKRQSSSSGEAEDVDEELSKLMDVDQEKVTSIAVSDESEGEEQEKESPPRSRVKKIAAVDSDEDEEEEEEGNKNEDEGGEEIFSMDTQEDEEEDEDKEDERFPSLDKFNEDDDVVVNMAASVKKRLQALGVHVSDIDAYVTNEGISKALVYQILKANNAIGTYFAMEMYVLNKKDPQDIDPKDAPLFNFIKCKLDDFLELRQKIVKKTEDLIKIVVERNKTKRCVLFALLDVLQISGVIEKEYAATTLEAVCALTGRKIAAGSNVWLLSIAQSKKAAAVKSGKAVKQITRFVIRDEPLTFVAPSGKKTVMDVEAVVDSILSLHRMMFQHLFNEHCIAAWLESNYIFTDVSRYTRLKSDTKDAKKGPQSRGTSGVIPVANTINTLLTVPNSPFVENIAVYYKDALLAPHFVLILDAMINYGLVMA